jgi:multiple sugar transport system ATP-binding protein
MADRIAVLNAGRLEQFGAPLELFEFPANKFVAGFIGSPQMNFFEGTIRSAAAESVTVELPGLGQLTLPVEDVMAVPGEKATLGIRPNHFQLGAPAGAGRHGMSFATSYAESVGTETYIYGRIDGNDADVVLHLPDHVPVTEGQKLELTVELSRLHLFHGGSGQSFARKRADGSRIAA